MFHFLKALSVIASLDVEDLSAKGKWWEEEGRKEGGEQKAPSHRPQRRSSLKVA